MSGSTSASERRLLLRLLVYLWAAPTTSLGLLLAGIGLLTGGQVRRAAGVLEAWGGFVTWALRSLVPLPGGAAALTLGHVVLGRDAGALDRTRAHERIHVRQAELWGPAFLPAYLTASLVARLRGESAYAGNRFEQEAVRAAAGERGGEAAAG